MPAPRIPTPARLVQAYYWLTPAFLFASSQLGIDVRLPFLDAMPGARAAYYILIFICAGLVYWRPDLTVLVGRAETTLSASVLIIATWSAYFSMIDEAAAHDATFHNPFTAETVASLMLSAGVFIASLMAQGGRAGATRAATHR